LFFFARIAILLFCKAVFQLSFLYLFYSCLVSSFYHTYFTFALQNCRTLVKAYDMNPVLHFLGYGLSIPLLLAYAVSKTRNAQWNLFEGFTCTHLGPNLHAWILLQSTHLDSDQF